jgi:uncharacterized membrane protein/protein-disulfide isomerase
MTPRVRWIILALALGGLVFAASSSWVHYKLLTDASYISPCDVNATFNCSQAYLSRYGAVAGVPVAVLGMLWFLVAALIAGFATPDGRKSSPAGAYLFAWSTVGLAVVLYLAYASFFVMQTACLLCIGTYVGVVGIFLASGSASSVPLARLPGRLAGDLGAAMKDPFAFVLSLILLGGTASLLLAFPAEGTRPAPQVEAPSEQATRDFATAWWQQPRVDLGIPADGAKVIVVKFNDYQCPGCRETHLWYKPVLAKYQESHPGAVKYILKDWPWHSRCNFNTTATAHDGACEAAAAVRMARDQGLVKEEEMEDWIFANLSILSPATVREAAQRILGITDFQQQYALKLPDIRRDIADGGALSIRSTPTLFINGVRIETLMPPAYFELAIQLEIDKAGRE